MTNTNYNMRVTTYEPERKIVLRTEGKQNSLLPLQIALGVQVIALVAALYFQAVRPSLSHLVTLLVISIALTTTFYYQLWQSVRRMGPSLARIEITPGAITTYKREDTVYRRYNQQQLERIVIRHDEPTYRLLFGRTTIPPVSFRISAYNRAKPTTFLPALKSLLGVVEVRRHAHPLTGPNPYQSTQLHPAAGEAIVATSAPLIAKPDPRTYDLADRTQYTPHFYGRGLSKTGIVVRAKTNDTSFSTNQYFEVDPKHTVLRMRRRGLIGKSFNLCSFDRFVFTVSGGEHDGLASISAALHAVGKHQLTVLDIRVTRNHPLELLHENVMEDFSYLSHAMNNLLREHCPAATGTDAAPT